MCQLVAVLGVVPDFRYFVTRREIYGRNVILQSSRVAEYVRSCAYPPMPKLLKELVGLSLPPAPSAKAHQYISSGHFCFSVEFSSKATPASNRQRHMNMSNNRAKAIRNDSSFPLIRLNLSFCPNSQATRLELQQAPHSKVSNFIGAIPGYTYRNLRFNCRAIFFRFVWRYDYRQVKMGIHARLHTAI